MLYNILFVLLSLTISGVLPQNYNIPTIWNVNKYPDPQRDYIKCGRSYQSSVCDPNRIISSQKADEIDMVIDQVRNDTRCLCYDCVQGKRGFLVKVALLEQMDKIFNTTDNSPDSKLADVRMYSYLLSLKWNFVGSCNETILILYSKNDNIVYTLTRKHAQLKLRDSDIVNVAVYTRHYFNTPETIGDGIKAMITGYRSILRGEGYKPYQQNDLDGSNGGTTSTISSLLLLLLTFTGLVYQI